MELKALVQHQNTWKRLSWEFSASAATELL